MELAPRLNGEIISVDSMQVYRAMDIGTAKPSAEARGRVRHHLIDVAELDQRFDAAQFVRMAGDAVKEIQSRGRTPIFCGGTGLYFKAWLEGLGDAPPSDPKLRAELAAMPLVELLEELGCRDPDTYEAIDRQNPRRVVRALEVIRLTGRPFSEQRAPWGKALPANDGRLFGITRRRVNCASASTNARTRCSATDSSPRRRRCSNAGCWIIRRRCRRWVTGRLLNICKGGAVLPRRSSW